MCRLNKKKNKIQSTKIQNFFVVENFGKINFLEKSLGHWPDKLGEHCIVERTLLIAFSKISTINNICKLELLALNSLTH